MFFFTAEGSSACPTPFVWIGSGCYYAKTSSSSSWVNANKDCENVAVAIGHEGSLAHFDDITVSQYH